MFAIIGTTTADIFIRGMPDAAAYADGFRANNLLFTPDPLLMLVGGNGANSAYVLGRLGAETALCSIVGRDHLGDWLAARLASEQVNLQGLIRHADLATSSSTILLSGAERQIVLHHKGSTAALRITDAHRRLYAEAQVLLASSYSLFPEMRAGGFAEALAITREAGGVTAVDIGPAIGEPVRLDELIPVLPTVDYLIANAHELRVCTAAADWETGAARLLDHGCRCVLIKKGAEGTSLRARDASFDQPSFPVSANISVGAGDSFNAGFLYAVHQNRPLTEAVRFGSALAALVVAGRRGVLTAPTLAEVESFLNQQRTL